MQLANSFHLRRVSCSFITPKKAMARATALCILAAAVCLLHSIAFVPATRNVDPAVATGAAVLATVPAGADAFVFKGAVAVGGDYWEVEVHQQENKKIMGFGWT